MLLQGNFSEIEATCCILRGAGVRYYFPGKKVSREGGELMASKFGVFDNAQLSIQLEWDLGNLPIKNFARAKLC